MSTYMQSLENSIEGSMKLGPVKTGQGDYLKCSIPDSLSYLRLLSGCLTHSQSFLWHQGLSWTTACTSPQRYMHADLARSSDLIKAAARPGPRAPRAGEPVLATDLESSHLSSSYAGARITGKFKSRAGPEPAANDS